VVEEAMLPPKLLGRAPAGFAAGPEVRAPAAAPAATLVDEKAVPTAGPAPIPAVRPLADVEREAIEHAMRVFGGNITHAARALCVNPSTIYRRMAIWAGASGTEVGN